MKLKLSIRQKIQFYIMTLATIIFALSFGYIGLSNKNVTLKNAEQTVRLELEKASFKISSDLNKNIIILQTLSKTLMAYNNLSWEEWEKLLLDIYKNTIEINPQIFSLWDSWEYSVIDSNYTKPYGRKVIIFWNENGIIKHSIEDKSMDGDPEQYGSVKKLKKACIWEPYYDLFSSTKSEQLLMTTLSYPIMLNNEFVGITSVDITLEHIQKQINEISPFPESYAFMLSNTGIIAAHPDPKLINKNINEIFEEDNKNHHIIEKINEGEFFNYTAKNKEGKDIYYAYVPIKIDFTDTPWVLALTVPKKVISHEANNKFVIALIVVLLGLLIMVIAIFYVSKSITTPIRNLTDILSKISKGHLDKNMYVNLKTGDELEEMGKAVNISLDGLIAKQEFSEQIGKGKFDTNLSLLSKDDSLGKSLNTMQSNLLIAKQEDEKRQIEEEKQNWTVQGQAKFAEILRQYNNDIEQLGAEIIKNLVKYMKANQGGIFLLKENKEEEEKYLSLTAAYAYNRPKLMQKNIKIGEGLIGACVEEKETTYLTDIPENYIEITSGLGGSTPTALLMIPLIIENKTLGAIEIAGFKKFEKYEIVFAEEVAKSIAATINTVQINLRTTELLKHSQTQAQEMKEQEEEMRQNMEELKATQEEAARKETEMKALVEAINISNYVIEYDINGYITHINKNYLELLKISEKEIIGTHFSKMIEFVGEEIDTNTFWNELTMGKVQKRKSTLKVENKNLFFAETYTPIKDLEGNVYKVLKISNLITQE